MSYDKKKVDEYIEKVNDSLVTYRFDYHHTDGNIVSVEMDCVNERHAIAEFDLRFMFAANGEPANVRQMDLVDPREGDTIITSYRLP